MAEELNELLQAAADGDNAAFARLAEMYDPLIRAMSARYAPHGADAADSMLSEQDLAQEARLALFRAASAYNRRQTDVSFGLYAKICIRNALVSARRKYSAAKRAQQNADSPPPERRHPSAELVAFSRMSELSEKIDGVLSPYEKKVFDLYISGRSVKSISLSVGKSEKSVSNAVYRIRIKIKGLL